MNGDKSEEVYRALPGQPSAWADARVMVTPEQSRAALSGMIYSAPVEVPGVA